MFAAFFSFACAVFSPLSSVLMSLHPRPLPLFFHSRRCSQKLTVFIYVFFFSPPLLEGYFAMCLPPPTSPVSFLLLAHPRAWIAKS